MDGKPQGRRPDRRRGGGRHRGGPKPQNGDRNQHHNQHQNQQRGPQNGREPRQKEEYEPMETDSHSRPPLTEAVPQDTPLFSELAGTNLVHPSIVQTITEDLKFTHMMPVQAATLWELLPPNSSDCLVQAKTGTGKTVAFLLPALQTMLNKKRGGPESGISLLVVSPTRELAMQIAQEAKNLLQRLPKYRVRIAIGGTNKDKEERQILEGCDVLIATPGRLIDHMSNENVLYNFRHLDTLVLDEADRLLDMGFMPALRDIVRYLPDKKVANRQSMLFSATIAPHVNQVAGIVLSPGYKFISTIPEGEVNAHERVPQLLIRVPSFDSVAAAMVGCIQGEVATGKNLKAIVFAPTAALADLYGRILESIPGLPPASILHSRISQSKRTKVTNQYRDSTSAILVATDVVARGMDFPGVTVVIQVGIPSEKQSYIHRLGRTARADADGRGIFIIADAEGFFPQWSLKEMTFIAQNADLTSAAQVYGIVEGMEDSERSKIYQAWLGYYNNHLKGLKWDKEELVRQANAYASSGLGAPETPSISKSTVGKMGLRGTRGLNTVPDPPKQRRGGGRRI